MRETELRREKKRRGEKRNRDFRVEKRKPRRILLPALMVQRNGR